MRWCRIQTPQTARSIFRLIKVGDWWLWIHHFNLSGKQRKKCFTDVPGWYETDLVISVFLFLLSLIGIEVLLCRGVPWRCCEKWGVVHFFLLESSFTVNIYTIYILYLFINSFTFLNDKNNTLRLILISFWLLFFNFSWYCRRNILKGRFSIHLKYHDKHEN